MPTGHRSSKYFESANRVDDTTLEGYCTDKYDDKIERAPASENALRLGSESDIN